MARTVTSLYAPTPTRKITAAQRRAAAAKIAKVTAKDPLRRIQLACDTRMRRDPLAVVGDHLWCDEHAGLARVVKVTAIAG